MKIALFSDVHANFPALEACLKSMDDQKPDAVYCLGDLVGYNVWPNEVINEVKRRAIPTIAGNYDQGIGIMSNECGCAYKTAAEKDMGIVSISFTNAVIEPEERKYLRTLPVHIKLQFHLNNEKFNVLMVHGSPRKINEYLFEDRDEKSLLRIISQADADIMCFGHTHKPFHRILPDHQEEKLRFRHAINIGSVGKPKDNDPRGCYVILSISEESDTSRQGSICVEFIRFNYDVEKAAKAIEESILPNEYAEMLRNGQ